MPRALDRLRKSLAPLAIGGACLLMLLAATGSSGALTNAPLPAGAIQPTERQQQLARQIASDLEQYHYSRRQIDKEFSAQVYDRYLGNLDGQRSYFLASDVAEMGKWRTAFDDMIHTGALEPAYAMFARLQERNRERIQYALSLLATEPDWKLDERYNFDREKAPWPRDRAELDDLWRQRVKSDALSLMLTGKSWPEAADILRKRYQRVLARVGQVSADDVFESLMNSYAAVYDPHTNYLAPRSAEEFRIQMSLSYEGIGASLQMRDDYVTVIDVIPGGPAAVSGKLAANDRITAVGEGAAGDMVD
ncbi:MAG: PDZ domain-containing protein, partial [Gammaproteobacteria bacterium]|nr:PDZ domain-containing protein [Gammaproteobacteria bacterium]